MPNRVLCLIMAAFAFTTQIARSVAADAEWDRTVLPRPVQPFQGIAKRTLEGSEAAFTPLVKAPPDAPNILLVLIDDAGFGNPSTFGGPFSTATFDKLAAEGLRYNRFHVTALCSPTRAALLSGRNHHAVGFGSISELIGGWPGYSTNWPTSAASIAQILQANGYNTAAIGKWHLTPDAQQGPAGPFDRWPNALGFDYFWGFLGGETGQFDPVLVENNSIIGVPKEKNFYLNDAMAEHSITWIRDQKAQAPDKPFFLYFSTGATHAPHQVPEEWIDKYKGKFDQGWDKLREETFARQKQLGVIPGNAKLTPRDPAFPAWDSVPGSTPMVGCWASRRASPIAGCSIASIIMACATCLSRCRPPIATPPSRIRRWSNKRSQMRASLTTRSLFTFLATTARAWKGRKMGRSTR